jgi:hypothetical protein
LKIARENIEHPQIIMMPKNYPLFDLVVLIPPTRNERETGSDNDFVFVQVKRNIWDD